MCSTQRVKIRGFRPSCGFQPAGMLHLVILTVARESLQHATPDPSPTLSLTGLEAKCYATPDASGKPASRPAGLPRHCPVFRAASRKHTNVPAF